MTTVPWTEVATRLRPFIAQRVRPSDVDDIVQDVLVRMHRGLPSLRDDERFTAWMFQVARNAIADVGRKQVDAVLDTDDTIEPPAPVADDDRDAATALAGCVSLFVAALPSPYREAVTLVELEGKTAKEAAEMVGISVSGMKSRVQRGRAQLRELFERCCEIAVDARGKPIDYTPRAQRCKPCS
ncbi:MAG TPA: sigma-70 family RNA polymerase sigma factor [Kofleriaceae bacterium]|nr:sigma-70 family RNA polymerase sigma factor [Kofleriaceae bacterium]